MIANLAVSIKPIRQRLRSVHCRLVLQRTLHRLKQDPEKCLSPSSNVISDLIYGWQNSGWSASQTFLRGCVREALLSKGSILECGSGLTTLVLGVIADVRGISVLSLEQDAAWAERVRQIASALGIRSVVVHQAPLKDYGSFSWYTMPSERLSKRFSLVVCDGPPGDTNGGRYGLFPVAHHTFRDDCVILLDDAIHQDEQAIARRWQAEFPLACRAVGEERPFFRFNRIARRVTPPRSALGVNHLAH
jgi:hypothetical protein